jgi:hypothetical protein
LLVFDRPERSSSSADNRPALKHECHSKSALRLKECSSKASRSISRVSLADLPSFSQNLVQTRLLEFAIDRSQKKHEVKKALM